MKPNRLREALVTGKTAVGHMILEFGTRGIARIAEAAGLDFVLIDMEHSGLDFGAVADLLAWFSGVSVAPIVRVPATEYHFIARVMDAGAMGVMAPNVSTPSQAREVISAMRYAPLGQRGLGLGVAHNNYIVPAVPGYLDEANQSSVAICQIESTMALENLDAIAATPGVDVLFVGHFDLTSSVGIVGELENPRFVEAIRRIANAARSAGKGAAMQPGSVEQAKRALDMEYNIISISHDTSVYGNALKSLADQVRS